MFGEPSHVRLNDGTVGPLEWHPPALQELTAVAHGTARVKHLDGGSAPDKPHSMQTANGQPRDPSSAAADTTTTTTTTTTVHPAAIQPASAPQLRRAATNANQVGPHAPPAQTPQPQQPQQPQQSRAGGDGKPSGADPANAWAVTRGPSRPGSTAACPGMGRGPAPPVKRLGAPLKPIAVMCSPPPPEQVAAKRMRGGGDNSRSGSRLRAAKRTREGGVSSSGGSGDDGDAAAPAGDGGGGGGGGGATAAAPHPAAIFGVFHPDRYLNADDCIDYQGNFISRSKFEKLGGSLMAKWYRSIRVATTDETLGAWLVRRGLPVHKGNPRQRKPTDSDGENDGEDGGGGGGHASARAAARSKSGSGGGGTGGWRTRKGSTTNKIEAPAAAGGGSVREGVRSSGSAPAAAAAAVVGFHSGIGGAEERRAAATADTAAPSGSRAEPRSSCRTNGGLDSDAAAAAGPAVCETASGLERRGSPGACGSVQTLLGGSHEPGGAETGEDAAVRTNGVRCGHPAARQHQPQPQQRGSLSGSSHMTLEERMMYGSGVSCVTAGAAAAAAAGLPAQPSAAAAAGTTSLIPPRLSCLPDVLAAQRLSSETLRQGGVAAVATAAAALVGDRRSALASHLLPTARFADGGSPLHCQMPAGGAVDARDSKWRNLAGSGYGDAVEAGGSVSAASVAAMGATRWPGSGLGLPSTRSCSTTPVLNPLSRSELHESQLQHRLSNSSSCSRGDGGGGGGGEGGAAGGPVGFQLPYTERRDGLSLTSRAAFAATAARAEAADAAAAATGSLHAAGLLQRQQQWQQQQQQQLSYTRDSSWSWPHLSSLQSTQLLSPHPAGGAGGVFQCGSGGPAALLPDQRQPILISNGQLAEHRITQPALRGGGGSRVQEAAADAAPPSAPAPLNRIEMVKLELLRGAAGGGAAATTAACAALSAGRVGVAPSLLPPPLAPTGMQLQPQQLDRLQLRRAWSDKFEERVEQLMRGSGGGGSAASGDRAAAAAAAAAAARVSGLGSPSGNGCSGGDSARPWLVSGGE